MDWNKWSCRVVLREKLCIDRVDLAWYRRYMRTFSRLVNFATVAGSLAAILVTIIAVMSPALRNFLAYGTAAEAIVPAGVLLAFYVTILSFVFLLKVFVIDDEATPRKRAKKKLLADALFRLASLLRRLALALSSWLELSKLPLFRVQPLNVFLIPQHQAHISLSPCWPQGYPHTHYA